VRLREQSVLYRRRGGVTDDAAGDSRRNHSSRRYTILDIVANNALACCTASARHLEAWLRRRPRADLDEGQKAIDVFHITKAAPS